MATYVVRRLIQAAFVLVIVSFLIFIAMRMLPGDPILIYLGEAETEASTEEQLKHLRKEYGLDKPIPVQYIVWVSGVLRGDFGKSISYGDSVLTMISESLPLTIHIGFLAFIISILHSPKRAAYDRSV